MGRKIRHKRGLKKNLPTLSSAEIGHTLDTNETFIGTENGRNIKLMSEDDVRNILSRLTIVNNTLYLDGQPISNPSNPSPPDPVQPAYSFGKIGKWFDETVNGETVSSSHYPGATIQATVTGTTKVIANFRYSGMGWIEPPIIAVRINGGTWNRYTMADTVQVASGLTKTNTYRIEIVFDGWSQTENLWGSQRKYTFRSLTLDAGGTSTYVNSKKNVLFVGDSITAGTRTVANNDAASGSSAVLSYSQILGDRMNANIYRSAFPGTKVIDTFTRDNVKLVSNNKPVPNYNIHTIIIEMGTNDNLKPSTDFISNYQLIIDSLRTVYPTQRIYIVGLFENQPSIRRNTELATIARNNANNKVTHIDTTDLSGVVYTDGLHPSSAGSQTISNFLYPKLTADGWENGGGLTVPPTAPVLPGNLWSLSGNPTSYNPLPMTYNSMPVPDSYYGYTFRVSFKGRSNNNSKVVIYTENQKDLGRTVVPLTETFVEHSYTFTVTHREGGNFLFFCPDDFTTDTGIILQDIVVEKI